MTYEEFVSAVHRAGLTTSATRKVLYLLRHGRKQPLVRWGKYNGDDELLCYIDIRTDTNGAKNTYGVPVEAVTPDMVRRFAESIKDENTANVEAK
jgi:hypothetical protein